MITLETVTLISSLENVSILNNKNNNKFRLINNKECKYLNSKTRIINNPAMKLVCLVETNNNNNKVVAIIQE